MAPSGNRARLVAAELVSLFGEASSGKIEPLRSSAFFDYLFGRQSEVSRTEKELYNEFLKTEEAEILAEMKQYFNPARKPFPVVFH